MIQFNTKEQYNKAFNASLPFFAAAYKDKPYIHSKYVWFIYKADKLPL